MFDPTPMPDAVDVDPTEAARARILADPALFPSSRSVLPNQHDLYADDDDLLIGNDVDTDGDASDVTTTDDVLGVQARKRSDDRWTDPMEALTCAGEALLSGAPLLPTLPG